MCMAYFFSFIWCSFCCLIQAQDIDEFKQTSFHQQNIRQITKGWSECPDWPPQTAQNTADMYSFDAQCITIQVPLNWDDTFSKSFLWLQSKIKTIDYFITRISSTSNIPNTKKTSLWMLEGGPGGSGESLYPLALPWMNFLGDTFDLFIPDHRGTGYSNALQACDMWDTYVNCVSMLDDAYQDNGIHYFSTYSASMDLGYAFDLFQNSFGKYKKNMIYGVSYGTYYLNQYLTLFPHQFDGAIFDSLCSADHCRFSEYDRIANDAGLQLLQKCNDNAFCAGQFEDLGTNILDATKQIFDNPDSLTCAAKFKSRFRLLQQNMVNWLRSRDDIVLIAPFIYRLYRCNDADIKAINNYFLFGYGSQSRSSSSQTPSSAKTNPTLYKNIVLSELWYGDDPTNPGASKDALMDAAKDYVFLNSPTIAGTRDWWDFWNKYEPKHNLYNEYAVTPIPMLILAGDLDSRTGLKQALDAAEQYGAVIDDNAYNAQKRYLVTFPNTGHVVLASSMIRNYSDSLSDPYIKDTFVTCGMYVVKSFMDESNAFIPDTQCIEWMKDIDWEGTTDATKDISNLKFGTTDVWGTPSLRAAFSMQSGTTSAASPSSNNVWWIVLVVVLVCLFGVMVIYFGWKRYFKKSMNNNLDLVELNDVSTSSYILVEN
eukprot:206893_1